MARRLVAVALLLALAGCGGASTRHARPAPTRAGFIARVNQVCREAASRTERIDGLRNIRVPGAAKELYGHLLSAEREALAAAKELANPTADPVGDPLVPLTIARGKITGYALRLGVHACEEPQAGTLQP